MSGFESLRTEEAEKLCEGLGYSADDLPYEEKIVPRHRQLKKSANHKPKLKTGYTEHARAVLAADELFDGNGFTPCRLVRAQRSLDQILEILHTAGEASILAIHEEEVDL